MKISDKKLLGNKVYTKANTYVINIIRYVFLISLSFLLIYPILYMSVMAFRPMSQLKDETIVWINSIWTFENLKTVWEYMNLGKVLSNSFFLSFGSAILSTLTCGITGYGLARFEFFEKKIFMFILILTIVVPPTVLSLATYLEYKDFSIFGIVNIIEMILGQDIEITLIDTPAVFFLPAVFGAGIKSGIFILVFYQFFRGLPKELEDAAYVDGAGPLKTFLRIAVPNTVPAIVVVMLLSTVWYWNDNFIPSTFAVEMQTISNRLTTIYSDMSVILGTASGYGMYNEEIVLIQAAMLIAVVPMLLLFLASQKAFMKNVATVGIVG